MRAAQVVTLDGPGSVRVTEVEEPRGDGSVLIDVHAAGVTFPDVLQSQGRYQYQPDLPFVPGTEVAGVVRTAPDGAAVVSGDRVAAFPGLGGFAEAVAVPPSMVFPIPETLSLRSAAALPMNYLTVHFALLRRGALRAGETVLVHGAAGGVGTASVQLASALGARVIAVTSSEEKADIARAAGAHDVVQVDGFRAGVSEITGGAGVDLIVDPVGGDRFTDSLRSLAPQGRLLVIGFTAGAIPTVKVNRLLLNNISVLGVGWGAFWRDRPEYLQEQWADVLPLLERQAVDPLIGADYRLEDIGTALTDLDERRAHGKVVVSTR